MENQENQFDVTSRIIEIMMRFNKEELTIMEAAIAMASEVEQYAEMKVEQFKQEQNEIADTNAQA
jgi:hypothetical protein